MDEQEYEEAFMYYATCYFEGKEISDPKKMTSDFVNAHDSVIDGAKAHRSYGLEKLFQGSLWLMLPATIDVLTGFQLSTYAIPQLVFFYGAYQLGRGIENCQKAQKLETYDYFLEKLAPRVVERYISESKETSNL